MSKIEPSDTGEKALELFVNEEWVTPYLKDTGETQFRVLLPVVEVEKIVSALIADKYSEDLDKAYHKGYYEGIKVNPKKGDLP